MLEIILIILLVLMLSGGIAYPHYVSSTNQVVPSVIWLLFIILLIFLIFRLTGLLHW
jgi:hypothetical protein